MGTEFKEKVFDSFRFCFLQNPIPFNRDIISIKQPVRLTEMNDNDLHAKTRT